jgi:Tfp pilus assembly protein PilZ
MEVHVSERRISRRIHLKTALRVRIWKSGATEQRAESENLSERGTFFATDAPLAIGSAVEILLKMPEEITGKPTTEWRCTGHVVRLEPVDSRHGKLGVGVQFDCYEILHSKANTAV